MKFPEDNVAFVIDLMLATGIGWIPVIDPDNRRLEGLICRKDILRLRSQYNDDEHERAFLMKTNEPDRYLVAIGDSGELVVSLVASATTPLSSSKR